MPVFSNDRDEIFVEPVKVRLTINGFPDFYRMLGVPQTASEAELEEAITSRGADLLAASFSRGGRNELVVLLERHTNDFRPILLDKVTRLAYDEQLRRHEKGESRALDFDSWKKSYGEKSALTRKVENASRSLKERFKAAFWDSEYF